MEKLEFPARINKYLAHMGYATRRSADTLIEAKRVFVNGTPAIIGQKIVKTDRVEIKDYDTSHYQYFLYYKPRGVITHSPTGDETDIVTRVKNDHSINGVFPIGRLDKDSEGLIILTNDGRITGRILDPEEGHEREYFVTVDKRITQSFLNALAKGVTIEGYKTKSARAEAEKSSDHSFSITLTEGKKHQVRRMCAALGYQVKTLKRTRLLNLELKRLKSGEIYKMKPKEYGMLLGILGLH